jgi:anti-anti-sigma factor
VNPHFEITSSVDGGSLVLWATGELDLSGRQLVIDEAAPAFVRGQAVILDLSSVTFIDASGIRALAACANAAACAGTRFQVRQARGRVAVVIEMTGFADLVVDRPVNRPGSASGRTSPSTVDGSSNPDPRVEAPAPAHRSLTRGERLVELQGQAVSRPSTGDQGCR